jgi:hypothetical protein
MRADDLMAVRLAIADPETAVTKLLGISSTLHVWLAGDVLPPSNVRIAPELIAHVQLAENEPTDG